MGRCADGDDDLAGWRSVANAGSGESGEGVPPIISTARHFVVSVFLISFSVASISQVRPTIVRT
jgi:hypothetical protein